MPMAGAVHFLVLVMLGAAVVVAILRGSRRPTRSETARATVAGMLAGLGLITMGIHMCTAGNPVSQWLIPSASVTTCLLFIRKPFVRRTLVALALAAGVALSVDYLNEVHGAAYIGVPSIGAKPAWHTWLTGLYERRGTWTERVVIAVALQRKGRLEASDTPTASTCEVPTAGEEDGPL